ncbi:methyltransferase domain-containing protein [Acidipropionibacterium jensenii]|uniref:class I SAM-dependent methyltransferase n=1 Tax=Acidipropionibacterium jensenii TaxID=1749 RepID=UPI00110B1BFE|nr:class I SAM-dependent methyltransferase [Acidipropionibacterium jensenii]QCV89094.1 methyltransferase domain-containing protein [Acidipropionibacterium jensenii]
MLEEPLRTIRVRFDARAHSYDSSAMHRALAHEVASFVDPGHGSAVLDVATGTGLVLRALARRCPDRELQLTGIDISPGMLEVARRRLPRATLTVGDAAALPFATDSFDLVTCVAALHLIPDVATMAEESARVLRSGGRAVTATFVDSDPGRHGGPNPDRARFDSLDKVAVALGPSGLRLVRHRTFRYGMDAVLVAEWTCSG